MDDLNTKVKNLRKGDVYYGPVVDWINAACGCLNRATYSALPDVKADAKELLEQIGYDGPKKMSKSDGN